MGAQGGGAIRRGQVAPLPLYNQMTAWECRPCGLPAGNYKVDFVREHRDMHAKWEKEEQAQRDEEAEARRLAAVIEANNKKPKKWFRSLKQTPPQQALNQVKIMNLKNGALEV